MSATSRVLGGLAGLVLLGFVVGLTLFVVVVVFVVRGAMESSWLVQGR
ncbi:hypothetical protein [Sorangium sp. So ce1151]